MIRIIPHYHTPHYNSLLFTTSEHGELLRLTSGTIRRIRPGKRYLAWRDPRSHLVTKIRELRT